jgi:hypothetical protein
VITMQSRLNVAVNPAFASETGPGVRDASCAGVPVLLLQSAGGLVGPVVVGGLLGDQRPGGHEGVRLHRGVELDGARHPDQRIVADVGVIDDDGVADGDAVADPGAVEHGKLLDVPSRPTTVL